MLFAACAENAGPTEASLLFVSSRWSMKVWYKGVGPWETERERGRERESVSTDSPRKPCEVRGAPRAGGPDQPL